MKVFRYTLTIKFGDFKNTREAITLIACICMLVGTFCTHLILYKCKVLFFCIQATPNAYRQINEQLHTFYVALRISLELRRDNNSIMWFWVLVIFAVGGAILGSMSNEENGALSGCLTGLFTGGSCLAQIFIGGIVIMALLMLFGALFG